MGEVALAVCVAILWLPILYLFYRFFVDVVLEDLK